MPTKKIPREYPIEIIAAAIKIPLGNVFSGFSVWSTSPLTASIPPYANNAKTKNDNIELVF